MCVPVYVYVPINALLRHTYPPRLLLILKPLTLGLMRAVRP
jgi:hypothetical protein